MNRLKPSSPSSARHEGPLDRRRTRDLDEIAAYLAVHYPTIAPAVERRIRTAVAWIARWPDGARRSAKRSGVRVFMLARYPYRIFYRVAGNAVEILHIHHAARRSWDEEAG